MQPDENTKRKEARRQTDRAAPIDPHAFGLVKAAYSRQRDLDRPLDRADLALQAR
jgi:hypothetical protein